MKLQISLFLLSFIFSSISAAWQQQSSGQDYITSETWEISFEDKPTTSSTKYVELTPELLAKLLQLKGQSGSDTGSRQPIDQSNLAHPNPGRQDQGQQQRKPPPTDWKSHGDSYELPQSKGWGGSGWKPRDEDGGNTGSGSNRWGSGNGWQPRDADAAPGNSGSGSSNKWGGSWPGGSGGDTGGAGSGSGSGSGSNKWGGKWPPQ